MQQFCFVSRENYTPDPMLQQLGNSPHICFQCGARRIFSRYKSGNGADTSAFDLRSDRNLGTRNCIQQYTHSNIHVELLKLLVIVLEHGHVLRCVVVSWDGRSGCSRHDSWSRSWGCGATQINDIRINAARCISHLTIAQERACNEFDDNSWFMRRSVDVTLIWGFQNFSQECGTAYEIRWK